MLMGGPDDEAAEFIVCSGAFSSRRTVIYDDADSAAEVVARFADSSLRESANACRGKIEGRTIDAALNAHASALKVSFSMPALIRDLLRRT
ncbi:diguanylate cyclase [Mycobacterium sp. PO1]|nr:diguanylate cyclase [Mycobacterium sp. PO1]GFM24361.1 Diguanylate cyclase [Mycobacterium sp. PO2]